MMIMNTAIIVAGGSGLRMESDIRKQYLLLEEVPVLSRTIKVFDECPLVDRIILVVPESDRSYCEKHILPPVRPEKEIVIVSGGNSRQESVFNGLMAVSDKTGMVVVHDGVRPFVTGEEICRCLDLASESGAAILAIPAHDTLKIVNRSGFIRKTMAREAVWMAQTPQAFHRDLLLKAHQNAVEKGFVGTDDASLVEFIGGKVAVARGRRNNFKITTPDDLALARALVQTGQMGLGIHNRHKIEKSRP